MNDSSRYRELITFCNILAISLRSGKPLPETMSALSAKSGNSQAALWCQNLADKLKDGYSAEDACRDLAGFDGVLARLMPLLGEKRLIRVLELYTAFLVNLALIKEQLTAVIFYPVIVLGLMVVNLLHLNFFLFPGIYLQILETGKPVPIMMRILYFANIDCWPLSLFFPGFMLLVFVELIRISFSAKISGESLVARVFGVAAAIKLQETSRLQGIISLYLQSGFSLDKAVATAADFAEGSNHESLKNVAAGIAHGNDPAEAFSLSPVLHDVYISSAGVGSLADSLSYLADSNNRQSTAALKKFSRNMFIITLLLTGLFVALITSGFYDSYYWVIWSFA